MPSPLERLAAHHAGKKPAGVTYAPSSPGLGPQDPCIRVKLLQATLTAIEAAMTAAKAADAPAAVLAALESAENQADTEFNIWLVRLQNAGYAWQYGECVRQTSGPGGPKTGALARPPSPFQALSARARR